MGRPTELITVIAYVFADSPVVEAQVQVDEEPFEVPNEELNKLLDEIKAPKRKRRKSSDIATPA
ncbi:hypothetical protein [Synechococcus sp. CC9616]|uniref:hypothetical protein n=1 Tax=Synechococcus sp. CC9616 TaxID=110663 RepID=UPI001E5F9D4B|nr:hypothetical protein [Synechococcus sp. CC9616]